MRVFGLFSLIVLLVGQGVYLGKKEFNFYNITNSFSTMIDGAQTCFLRINQTYSAKMIGLDSSYLKRDFFTSTENCYKDLLGIISLKAYEKKDQVSGLSDKVYWFHRQKSFDNPFTGAGKDNFKETLTSKFKEIERINNKLVNWLQSKKDKLYAEQKSLFKYWVFTLVLLMITIVIALWGNLKNTGKTNKSNKFIKSVPEDFSGVNHSVSFEAKQKINEEVPKAESLGDVKNNTVPPKVHDYLPVFKDVMRDLSHVLFNLNTPIQVSGLENLVVAKPLNFEKDDLFEYLRQVCRFASGGKFPVHLEISKEIKRNNEVIKFSSINTNYCLFIDKDIKNSLPGLSEIITHDKVNLGFRFDQTFKKIKSHEVSSPVETGLQSVFVGNKKELEKKLKTEV